MSPRPPHRRTARATASRRASIAVLSGALAALLIAGCSNNVSGPSTSNSPPVIQGAPFQWSMPARFGQDANNDGLIDYPDAAQIHPASWTVNFDACNIAGDHYRWYVDSVSVGSVSTCKFSYPFPAEGSYDVAVDVTSAAADTTVRSEQQVVVQDWLILSIGDSYASGEGNPDVPVASDTLITAVEASVTQLMAAKQQLQAAQQSLQSALSAQALAQQAYDNAVQLLNQFQAACSTLISSTCVTFLTAHSLSFPSLSAAQAYFNQLVANAQQRLTDAKTAVAQAQAAVSAAQTAVTDAQAALQREQAGFGPPKWHAKYPVEQDSSPDPYLCHRSANAAPAQAALALEQADPHTSVTFVHLACSGAKIEGGGHAIDRQIKWANKLIGNREIDAVIVSIGGNDLGFSKLATACVEQQPCYSDNPIIDPSKAVAACAAIALVSSTYGTECTDTIQDNTPQQSAKQILDSTSVLLPGRYGVLATQDLPLLQGLLRPDSGSGTTDPAQLLRSNRVYITEYGDLTKNDAGAYCTPDPTDPLGTMAGVSVDEMQWLDQNAEADLNGDVRSAASQYGWNYVTGIYAGYTPHGYCAHDHWITRLDETYLRQGDHYGMAHPNREGQQFSAGKIEDALLKDLYPNGIDAPPRLPDPSSARGGGN
ncbi:MAG: hypothetical protein LJF06_18875 [Gemmatimonadetes bacterium]|nr:hypothetical protein [Gemmatimonadota bacterium]